MTKQRHCYVTDVGTAIEALASALDPERKPPFSGDILDLLEWAARDVLAMRSELDARPKGWHHDEVIKLRQQLGSVSEEFGLPKGIGPAPGEIKRILSDLRHQLADLNRICEFDQKTNEQLLEQRDQLRQQLITALDACEFKNEAIDLLVDFGQTVAGSASFWEEVWPKYESAIAAEQGQSEWKTDDELRKQLATMTAERDAYIRDYGKEQDRKREVAQQLSYSQKQVTLLRQQLTEKDQTILDHVEIQNALRQQVTLLRDFVTKVSEQLPEKPDHWSSCSQCEYNASDAEDIIEAISATTSKEQGLDGPVPN